jgi:hypothetical protein
VEADPLHPIQCSRCVRVAEVGKEFCVHEGMVSPHPTLEKED